MRTKALLATVPITIALTGCGLTDIARNAADTTACKALESTIQAIANGYQSGVID